MGERMETKKETRYRMHPESIGTEEDLYTILGEIGNSPLGLPIFQVPRRKALIELLTIHSELAFLHLKGGVKKIPDLNPALDARQSERMIQKSLKWVIKWGFDYCDENRKTKPSIPSRKEMIQILIFAFKYDLFREMLFSASKGGYSIKINNSKIEFVSENVNHAFLAYNSWRQAYRERIQFNNIQSTGIEAIKEVQFSEFTMPQTWNIGKYTLKEYKDFSVSLDELLTRWIKNHGKKNSLIIVGQYRSQDLIKIFHKNWWCDQITKISGLPKKTVENIISDLTYSNIKNNDPAYQFFVPLSEEELALSVCFTSVFVRPERNLMALLPKMEKKLFDRLSNDCESQQIKLIEQSISNTNVIIAVKKTKAQETRPGMDILFLDTDTLDLLVVELKWTISPSGTSEMYAIDGHVKKGLARLPMAQEYVTQNMDTILFEYFGSEYKGKHPRRHEYCVVMHESVGTGDHCDPFAHVITLDHLIELLKKGVGNTIDILLYKNHRVPIEYYSEVPMSFELLGYKIHCAGTELQGLWLDKTLPAQKNMFA